MKPASCFRDLASFSNRQKRLQQNRRYAVEIHNGTILERVSWLSSSTSRRLNRISGRTSAQQWIVRRGNSVRQHEGIEIDVARGTGASLSTRSMVNVPASTCCRSGGQGSVASLVGSPG